MIVFVARELVAQWHFFAMGQAQSSISQSSVSTAVTQTIISSLQNCGGSASSTQELNVSGSNNVVSGITMNQTAALNFTCLSNPQQLSALQSQISNTIASQLSQSSVGDTSGGAAATKTAISNEVANSFSASNIQNCFANLAQVQKVAVSGSGNTVSNVDMSTAITATVSCVSSQIAGMTSTMSAINSASATSSNTTSSPLDFIGSLFSGLTAPLEIGIGVFVFVIVAIVVAIVVKAFGGTSSSGYSGQVYASMPPPGYGAYGQSYPT